MNQEHVERLNSIEKLEKEGFEGYDVSLEISLRDYGIVWKVLKDSTAIYVYQILNLSDGSAKFDRAVMTREDFKGMDWVEENSPEVYESAQEQGWVRGIAELYSYYGYEEIFGSSYWEGFDISGFSEE